MTVIFEKFTTEICQGDIFIPTEQEISNILKIDSRDIPVEGFIVLSNTCDIKNKNISYMSVSPFIPLKYLVEIIAKRKSREKPQRQSQNQLRVMLKTC